MGISRVHVLIVGPSGAGKSSTVKSILKFAGDIAKQMTRITQNALGYLDIDSFDGYTLFIEQIDGQTMNYLRELMSEEKICTAVTEKDADGHLETREKCIYGQPAVISTSVVDTIDVNKEQLFNRFLKAYIKPDTKVETEIWKAILERRKVEVSKEDAIMFRAWLLSRPTYAELPSNVEEEIINFMKTLKQYTRETLNRTVEVARNLIITTAIMRGKNRADLEDWDFVKENFLLDILYNGLGLSERDVEFIETLPNEGGLKTQEVADALKVSKQYALNVLKNLERKGLVEGEKEDGKTFTWYLTPLGRKIKALVNNVGDVVVVKNDKGELVGIADKFRNDADGRGYTGDAVRGDDGGTMQRGDGENDRVIEAYKRLKEHGPFLVTDLTQWFGDDIIEALKRKDLVAFTIVDGVEYVEAK
ncbi:helix-turn-helix domain-containing protein [Saccharolobus shibatae]|nr:helix-turn-helix domain-containing protein [Saccharolobus shibatae]